MRINPRANRFGACLFAATIIATPLSVAPNLVTPAAAQSNLPGVQVGAQKPRNIFEALFPDLIEQRLRRERALNPPVEVQKVSAPKYYEYKPVALVRIDLSRLVPVADETPQASPAAATLQDIEGGESDEEVARLMIAPAEPEAPAQAAFDRVVKRFGNVSVMAEPDIAKAVVAYYEDKGEVLWLDDDLQPNARARSLLPVLAGAAEWGLDPRDYRVDLPAPVSDEALAEEEAARFEVEMTARAVRYGIDAATGRVNPNKLSGYHDLPSLSIGAGAMLEKIAAGSLPAPLLLSQHPDNAPFMALKAELAALKKQEADEDIIVIPSDTLIKPGETHAEVPNVVRAIGKKGTAELREKFADLLAGPAP